MKRRLSIIMYHYVRELKNSDFPEIKGLPITQFKEQLKYIQKYYNVIKMEDLIDMIKRDKILPKNPLLLTFDDGFIDHFLNVFPILDEFGFQGSFFPSAKAIVEHKVLDVSKIHFILASVNDKMKLVNQIFLMLDQYRKKYSLKSNEYYYSKFAVNGRYDPKEVIFIKRILQRELPEKLRTKIVSKLFKQYVSNDEPSFSRNLYLNIDQLKFMKRSDMYIGSHGYNHYWLDHLEMEKQEEEINLSLDFLKKVGCDIDEWVICYPHGAYNQSLLSILKRKGCVIGLTTKVGISNLENINPLTLPRLNTNDLPKESTVKFSNFNDYNNL